MKKFAKIEKRMSDDHRAVRPIIVGFPCGFYADSGGS